MAPTRLLPWRPPSMLAPVRRWAGRHPLRRLTNAWQGSTNTLLRRPVESALYVSIKYAERLAEAGIEPSAGSVGDSYDNPVLSEVEGALAKTINGPYKAEVIHRRRPWRSFEAVEYATLEWAKPAKKVPAMRSIVGRQAKGDGFNHRRLLEPIGNIPPAEAEEQYYAMIEQRPMAA